MQKEIERQASDRFRVLEKEEREEICYNDGQVFSLQPK